METVEAFDASADCVVVMEIDCCSIIDSRGLVPQLNGFTPTPLRAMTGLDVSQSMNPFLGHSSFNSFSSPSPPLKLLGTLRI